MTFSAFAEFYARLVRRLVEAAAWLANFSIIGIMLLTCADVLLRIFSRPIVGAYDLVRLLGAAAMGLAFPYVTAVKGHVAIEYFFQKLNAFGRSLVARVLHAVSIAFFAFLGRELVRAGLRLQARGEVTPTLQLPYFWIYWLLAAGCLMSGLVLFYYLLEPRKELIRP
ncbi:MAG: TRAP transporter small permease [candidate division KSB1 bacterium]|nr:TRAP transporter small permease [candidate division KSB1 bacterium]